MNGALALGVAGGGRYMTNSMVSGFHLEETLTETIIKRKIHGL